MHIMTIDDAISIHGMHNYENICAAIAATEDLADPYSQLRAITKFKGIEKFDNIIVAGNRNNSILIYS